MKPTCLIIDQMEPGIIPMLEEVGIAVSYQPDMKAAEVKKALAGYHILIVRSKLHITADLIAEAPDLRIIARAGAGTDNIDENAVRARNIRLVNAAEGNRTAVGEFTLGLLLNLLRNISRADSEVKNRNWQREANRGEEIAGKTIGIIGYGNMGKSFARCLSGFDCRVLAYDTKGSAAYDSFAEGVTLQQIFEEADVVSFHIPYTARNYRFAGHDFFGKFRKPVWVLNTARGEVMDYSALVKNLQNGKVKGAGLDVLENEKLGDLKPEEAENFDYLSEASNVILTPHIAGWSYQSYRMINEVLTAKIKHLMSEPGVVL